MSAPKFEILSVTAEPIEACVRLPLRGQFYISLTTIFKPELRVFQKRASDVDDDVTHLFFEDPSPYPSAENIHRAIQLFNSSFL